MNVTKKKWLAITLDSVIKALLVAALVLGLGWSLVQVANWKNEKPVVMANEDGTIKLTADQANIHGPGGARPNLYAGRRNIGWWDNPTQSLLWNIEFEHPGTYRVEIDYALPANLKTDCLLKSPTSTLEFTIKGTGGWDKWKTISPGTLTIHGGDELPIQLIATHIHQPKGVMNFAELRLIPVNLETTNKK